MLGDQHQDLRIIDQDQDLWMIDQDQEEELQGNTRDVLDVGVRIAEKHKIP